jgi:hypothetical protein
LPGAVICTLRFGVPKFSSSTLFPAASTTSLVAY